MGCCSYEDSLFSYYKSALGHSSLLIDGVGDGVFEGIYFCPYYAFPECSGWQGNEISGFIESSVPQWKGIRWERKLKLILEGFEICDQVQNVSGVEKEFTFIFNLSPQVKCTIIDGKNVALSTPLGEFVLKFHASSPVELMKKNGQCFVGSEHMENIQLYVKIRSEKEILLDTQIRPI